MITITITTNDNGLFNFGLIDDTTSKIVNTNEPVDKTKLMQLIAISL